MKQIKLLVAMLLLGMGGVLGQGFNVSSPLVEVFTVAPGANPSGEIVFTNSTNQTIALKLSQGDYQFVAGGATQFSDMATQPRSNAAWITLSRTEVSIPANGRITVGYSLQVPQDAKLSGSFWSAIFAEPLQSATEVNPNDTVGVGLTQKLRYAIQIIANIGDSGQPRLRFLNPKIVKEGDAHFLLVDVQNQGDRYVRPGAKLDVLTEDGKNAGTPEAIRTLLLPDSVVSLRIAMGQLKQGKYQAALILDDGGRFVFGARYRFEVKAQ